ncbi:MAG: hypothetical protein NDJ92_13625 [Thermoanaerobaculia bacterium]|nr:hypothetical protein [Thermoanaerobaculia bacterium]
MNFVVLVRVPVARIVEAGPPGPPRGSVRRESHRRRQRLAELCALHIDGERRAGPRFEPPLDHVEPLGHRDADPFHHDPTLDRHHIAAVDVPNAGQLRLARHSLVVDRQARLAEQFCRTRGIDRPRVADPFSLLRAEDLVVRLIRGRKDIDELEELLDIGRHRLAGDRVALGPAVDRKNDLSAARENVDALPVALRAEPLDDELRLLRSSPFVDLEDLGEDIEVDHDLGLLLVDDDAFDGDHQFFDVRSPGDGAERRADVDVTIEEDLVRSCVGGRRNRGKQQRRYEHPSSHRESHSLSFLRTRERGNASAGDCWRVVDLRDSPILTRVEAVSHSESTGAIAKRIPPSRLPRRKERRERERPRISPGPFDSGANVSLVSG